MTQDKEKTFREKFSDEFSYDCDGYGCLHAEDFLMKRGEKRQEYNEELRDRLLGFFRKEILQAINEFEINEFEIDEVAYSDKTWAIGYNAAVKETNKKVAQLREKYE